MDKKDLKINGNIETLYLIPFICGTNEINKASKFLEENANIKIKIPNFSKKINILIKKNYLIVINNPKKTKHYKKKINVNKDLIIKDMILRLKNVTQKFTYQFKIDGKKITKKKKFSYDNDLKKLEEMLNIISNKNKLINIFQNFIKLTLINRTKYEKINRKTKNFSYENLIEQFIEGFALNKRFIQEYHDYIDEEKVIIIQKNKFSEKNNLFIKQLRKVCKNFKLIKNLNENSLYVGLIIKD